jgi:outer membrane receptor protein involved in Fe transport
MIRHAGRQFHGLGDRAQCSCGCASCGPGKAPPGLGGLFSVALDAAGAFIGDPALGEQIAAKSGPGWAAIHETPQQIAVRVAPDVKARLSSGNPIASTAISAQAQQIGAAIASDVAASLLAQGVRLPAGTVGAELQKPSVLDAFGGSNRSWVLIGGLALAGLLLFKEL